MPPEATATDQQTDAADQQSAAADQADSNASGVKVDNSAGDSNDGDGSSNDGDGGDEGQIDLIGQDRFDALKGDPEALRKELNRAATQKFQKLAKSQKVLQPYVDFIKDLDSNPKETIISMAKQFGLKIEGAENTPDPVETLDQRISAAVRQSLGEEYGDLADRLAPAIRQAAEMVATEVTKPAKEQLESVIQDSALREANAAIAAFGQKHPDWEKHEEAMTELSARLPPGEGMTEGEYLEILYTLVTRDKATGDGVKKIINRIAKAAGNSDDGGSTVSGKHVALTPGKLPTFAEAAAAAKRGETFE